MYLRGLALRVPRRWAAVAELARAPSEFLSSVLAIDVPLSLSRAVRAYHLSLSRSSNGGRSQPSSIQPSQCRRGRGRHHPGRHHLSGRGQLTLMAGHTSGRQKRPAPDLSWQHRGRSGSGSVIVFGEQGSVLVVVVVVRSPTLMDVVVLRTHG